MQCNQLGTNVMERHLSRAGRATRVCSLTLDFVLPPLTIAEATGRLAARESTMWGVRRPAETSPRGAVQPLVRVRSMRSELSCERVSSLPRASDVARPPPPVDVTCVVKAQAYGHTATSKIKKEGLCWH